ncbi:MAG: HPP family protein [Polyangiaceae bacterium]
MSKTVGEIMNGELFSLHPEDRTAEALTYFTALGISGAPVVDEAGHPLGIVSYPDLVAKSASTVADCMSVPVLSITPKMNISDAARQMAEARVHRLVVCDEEEHVIGMVSAWDLMRALVGMPPAHPAAFPHLDRETGLSFNDALPLDEKHIDAAPSAAGVFTLSVGGVGQEETALWAEAVNNVRSRLYELMSIPQTDRRLARLLDTHHQALRFQAVGVPEADERQRALEALQARMAGWRKPR